MSESEADEKRVGCGPLLRPGRDGARSLRQEVFDSVRASGRAARAEITQALDISAGSVTTLTADLISMGLLREVEHQPKETGRGRPRVALEVVHDAAYVIGIKLGMKQHTAVLVDFAGAVVASAALTSGAGEGRRSLASLMQETEALFSDLLTTSGKARKDIHAIGIGMPGIIDYCTGVAAWSSLYPSRGENLGAQFTAKLGCPVVVDNDANMLTLAELWFGEGRARRDFAVVTIESGVGMGLVLGNELYRGPHAMGLELGHTKVQLDGALCQCGQRGCLEAYLADYALIREAHTALNLAATPELPSEDMLDALYARAKAGDEVAEVIFRRAGRYLSLALANVVQLFDPTLIILSGARMQYDYFYSSEVLDQMQKMVLDEGRGRCKVVINAWGDMVWARGASALALSHATSVLVGGEARAA